MGRAAVPSGASTGAHEAVELRDGDKKRYLGKGVLEGRRCVNGEIFRTRLGLDATDQRAIDRTMIELDGTPNKGRLGANAILGVSLAVAKAAADARACRSIAMSAASRRARPAGADDEHHQWRRACRQPDRHPGIHDHAGRRRKHSRDAVRMGAEVFHTLKKGLHDAGHNTNVGDEGGFAPNLVGRRRAGLHHEGDREGGLQAGRGRLLGARCASTEFFKNGKYEMEGRGQVAVVRARWPYLADLAPLSDHLDRGRHGRGRLGGLEALTDKLGEEGPAGRRRPVRHQPEAPGRRHQEGLANSILVKVNQIGTLTETLEAVDMAHRAGYTP
jgi:enolase